ncbi:MAG: thioredoxin [Candidatus Krumholzibacteriota bacterium]|nr:thioredoxin [Candidatus Krumholzibacteriota bacterium]
MSEKLTHVTDINFQEQVLDAEIPVVVDFWAPWCGPCHIIGPIIEELSDEYGGKVKFVKINTDDAREIATKYGIMGIPTLKVFKAGEEINSLTGAAPKGHIKDWIDNSLGF